MSAMANIRPIAMPRFELVPLVRLEKNRQSIEAIRDLLPARHPSGTMVVPGPRLSLPVAESASVHPQIGLTAGAEGGTGVGVRLPMHLAVAGSQQDRAPTIPDAIRDWKVWLEAQGYSIDSRKRYVATIEAIVADCAWETLLDATTSDISRWFSRRAVAEKWSGRTQNNRLSAVRTFFGWVKEQGWRGENPGDHIACTKHVEGEGMREFTLEEMRLIIAAAEGRRRAVYILLATTGLRKSNICLHSERPDSALRWGWVNLDTATLRFPAGAMKSRRAHELPMTSEGVTALREIRPDAVDPAAVVFPFWVDNRTLHDDLERAGIARVNGQGEAAGFHSFRKGYLTALADAGVHPRTAQELAGHSDIKLTMRVYTKARMGQKRAAAENIFGLTNSVQTGGYENPVGPGSGICVDNGEEKPSHTPVRLQHPKSHADSPAAPCVEGPAGSLTSSEGSRRGGPSGCRVSGFPGSASSGMTPRGFEPRRVDSGRGDHGETQELPRASILDLATGDGGSGRVDLPHHVPVQDRAIGPDADRAGQRPAPASVQDGPLLRPGASAPGAGLGGGRGAEFDPGAGAIAPEALAALTAADKADLREKVTDAHIRWLALMAALAVVTFAAVRIWNQKHSSPTPEPRIAVPEDWRLP